MKLIFKGFVLPSMVVLVAASGIAKGQDTSFSGKVGRVWEDGLRLEATNQRSITVDTYDVCGDNTPRFISVGDQITITGEFEWGEFDAFSITKADGSSACR
jgi:hypothetical protein